jgi:hypothetical protein
VRVEDGRVAALGDRDHDGVAWRGGVVLAQLVPQPPRVDADDGIGRGGEVHTLAVQLDREYVLLELVTMPVERLFDDEFQKGRQAFRAGEQIARENLRELGANGLRRQAVTIRKGVRRRSRHADCSPARPS